MLKKTEPELPSAPLDIPSDSPKSFVVTNTGDAPEVIEGLGRKGVTFPVGKSELIEDYEFLVEPFMNVAGQVAPRGAFANQLEMLTNGRIKVTARPEGK